MRYENCTEITDDLIYEAFSGGFSDYMIQMKMDQEMMIKRFFGPEGNKKEYSFIAFDDEKPVGLILGGIRDLQGIPTMRCGTMCVLPEYRGTGVAKKLMELHIQCGKDRGCKQMFLEVIKGNDRAVSFYEFTGYDQVHHLEYYSAEKSALRDRSLGSLDDQAYQLREANLEEVEAYRSSLTDIHFPWQWDVAYYKPFACTYHVIEHQGAIVGAMGSFKGIVFMLHVDKNHRLHGLGASMIGALVKKEEGDSIRTAVSGNALFKGFLTRIGFAKDKLSQWEMYMTL